MNKINADEDIDKKKKKWNDFLFPKNNENYPGNNKK